MNSDSAIFIRSVGSVSPLGALEEEVCVSYKERGTLLQPYEFGSGFYWAGRLPERHRAAVESIRDEHARYRTVDPSVLYAMYAARLAWSKAAWPPEHRVGVNIASSRGATQVLETDHATFLNSGKTRPLTSPETTLGNLSYWVAQDLGATGPVISHSITCSSALHAVLNGVAWIRSGMAQGFLVGGTEAALTDFTLAQMRALKIYSGEKGRYPCRPMDLEKTTNTMAMGEGASMVCLSTEPGAERSIRIAGMGYATESLEHGASISDNGACFQRSMQMAIKESGLDKIDVVVTHAPGTLQGDKAEWQALKAIFKKEVPAITNNKWKIGHTFGASGLMSLEMAVIMLRHQEFIPVPYINKIAQPKTIHSVLVNAVGFGGNAVSLVLTLDAA